MLTASIQANIQAKKPEAASLEAKAANANDANTPTTSFHGVLEDLQDVKALQSVLNNWEDSSDTNTDTQNSLPLTLWAQWLLGGQLQWLVNTSAPVSHVSTTAAPEAISRMEALITQWTQAAQSSGKPIRIDLGQGHSLVLRINQNVVSADFIAPLLAQNQCWLNQQAVDALRYRMSQKQLPVGTFRYRHSDSQAHDKQSDHNKNSAK